MRQWRHTPHQHRATTYNEKGGIIRNRDGGIQSRLLCSAGKNTYGTRIDKRQEWRTEPYTNRRNCKFENLGHGRRCDLCSCSFPNDFFGGNTVYWFFRWSRNGSREATGSVGSEHNQIFLYFCGESCLCQDHGVFRSLHNRFYVLCDKLRRWRSFGCVLHVGKEL